MKKVVMESPCAGDIEGSAEYARACMYDCFGRGEAPVAGHLPCTRPGVPDGPDPGERGTGIMAGPAWLEHADLHVFYTDLGWDRGMLRAREHGKKLGIPYEERSLIKTFRP